MAKKSYTGHYLRPILAGHEALQPSEVIEALAKKNWTTFPPHTPRIDVDYRPL